MTIIRQIFATTATFAAVCIFAVNLYSQTIPVTTKLGKVSKEECEMKTYEADTSAAVVILWKKEEVKVDYDPNRMEIVKRNNVTHRIKILKEEGKSYADHSFLINTNHNENFNRLQVSTYNMENGAVVQTKLNKKDVIRSQYSDYVMKYSFAAPNVKVGSVIEIYYECESTRFFDIADYYFQQNVPVNISEYSIGLPNWMSVNKAQRGSGVLQVSHSEQTGSDMGTLVLNNTIVVDHYKAVDLPAMKNEKWCYCTSQYRTAVSYDIMAITIPGAYKDYGMTWDKVAETLRNSDIFKRLKANCRYEAEVKAIMGEDIPENEKIAKIAELTRSKVQWNEKSAINPASAEELLKARTGNNADINSLAATAYKAAGFNVAPVFVRKRTNGILLKHKPTTDCFSTFILKLGSADGNRTYFIDASDKNGYINVLNDNYLVDSGFAVDKDGFDWVDLRTLTSNIYSLNVNASVSSDGTMTGNINASYSNSEAYDIKEFHNNAEKEEDIIESTEKALGVEISDYQSQGCTEYSDVCQESMAFTKQCDCTPDMIIIDPFLQEFQDENDFRAEKRELPVEFGHCFSALYRLSLEIPQGYIVEQLPARARYASPLPSSTMIQCIQNGNTIQLVFKYDLKTIFSDKDQYLNVKTYWNQLCTIYKQKIILKKAN